MNDFDSFGPLRRFLFPIHGSELRRFLPMALMMLCVVFNYTVLRNFKDSLIVNAPGSDAAVIAFLKMWGTTPIAILFMLFYAKWVEKVGREKMVYISLLPLCLFFVFFGFFLYPNRDFFHPSESHLLELQNQWPHFKWWLAIWGNWSYALFFIASELCGTISMSLFFWQFANATCDRHEAKRFYPLFGVIGNLGLILAGKLTQYYSSHSYTGSEASQTWTQAIQIMLGLVCCSLVAIQFLYYWLNRSLAKDPIVGPRLAMSSGMPKRPRSSLTQSLRHVLSSPHLLYIAILVFSYGLTINFCDVLWKSEVKSFFKSDPAGYSAFMGHFSVIIGLLTIPLMLISSHLLRRISWIAAAILPALIMLVAGGGFFAGIFWGLWQKPSAEWMIAGMSISPLWLAVYFGFWQNALSKASKYSLFDPTKEMAYIPLDEEVKIKGKAAVDVVGSRFGKTGGSLTFFLLQTFLPQLSLQELSPFIFAIFLAALGMWILALNRLQPLLNTTSCAEEPAK